MTDTTLELRLKRLEAMRETEKAAILDAFRQLDALKDRVDRHYARIRALEGDPIQQPAEIPAAACPPPVGGLVEVVGNAIATERLKWLGVGDHEARAAIRAVAWWLKQGRMLSAAELLQQEAKAPRQAPVPQSRVMP